MPRKTRGGFRTRPEVPSSREAARLPEYNGKYTYYNKRAARRVVVVVGNRRRRRRHRRSRRCR